MLFFMSTSSIVGPNDDQVIPKGSRRTDWEVELAIIIGKKAKHVTEVEAMPCVSEPRGMWWSWESQVSGNYASWRGRSRGGMKIQ
jgi:hypothetical protein